MTKPGITIVKNTGSFTVGFYPDEKSISFSNVVEVVKSEFNDDNYEF